MRKLPDALVNYIPGSLRYGESSVYPNGTAEVIYRCVEMVWRKDSWHSSQCLRKRGYGYKGLFCKQHSKEYENPEETV